MTEEHANDVMADLGWRAPDRRLDGFVIPFWLETREGGTRCRLIVGKPSADAMKATANFLGGRGE